jgi:hypothetical protein
VAITEVTMAVITGVIMAVTTDTIITIEEVMAGMDWDWG